MNFQKFCAEILPHISKDGVPIDDFSSDYDNLQVKNAYGDWEDAEYNLPDLEILEYEYRIKPKPDYRPFKYEEEEIFFGMKVYRKDDRMPCLIVDCDEDAVFMPFGDEIKSYTYETLLKDYIFPNDIACGVMS